MWTNFVLFSVIWIFVTVSNVGVAQEAGKSIYVFKDRYDDKTKEYIDNNDIFKEIKLLGGYMIDPGNKNVINLKSVLTHLEVLFPDAGEHGILCINLENNLYKNLKNFPASASEFKSSIREFNVLLRFIKFHRPNVKVGIYGIPYRTYYPSQMKWNESKKFDVLLSKVDFIFPSLYILFPDRQKGAKSNLDYFKQNLDTAFEYGSRLGKPVIPFIWYMVNPGNKKYGGELLNLSEMQSYLSFVFSYSSFDQGVSGVVWWESSNSLFERFARLSSDPRDSRSLPDKNLLLRKYTKHLHLN